MQLSEILEESDIDTISKKTKLSKQSIHKLMHEEFEGLIKAKALGFISILEREYQVDLSVLREKALTYYKEHGDDERIVFTPPVTEEDTKSAKGSFYVFVVVILGIIFYLLWYVFTHYDEQTLRSFIPFIESVVEDMNKTDK